MRNPWRSSKLQQEKLLEKKRYKWVKRESLDVQMIG